MELTRTRVSNRICDTCKRKPCCLQGPRGFPGEQGNQGQQGRPGTSHTDTMKFSSGVLSDVFVNGNLLLGFGASYSLALNSIVANGFQIPIPRDGILTNFTVSVAQSLHNIDPAGYGFRILSIPSSLDGTAEPMPALPPPLLPSLPLIFPATLAATPLQASMTDTTSYNVSAGDRLVVVVVSTNFVYGDTGEQTFNASFDYTYNV